MLQNLHNYNIDDYKKLNALGGYVEAIMNGVTYYPTISFNGSVFKSYKKLNGITNESYILSVCT